MPGSGPPVPDLVLNAIHNGATWIPLRGEWGALDVNGVVQRLVTVRTLNPDGAWALDPDAGAFMDHGTFQALQAWAKSAARHAPIQFDEAQLFALVLMADTVKGTPIVRVVVTGPAD